MDEVWKRCWNKVFLLVEERREFRTDNNFKLFACGLWCIEFVESNALTVHTMYRLYLRTGSLWIVLTSKWKTSVFHAGDVLGVLTINDFSASIGKVDGLSFMCGHKSIKTVKVDALIVQAMYRVYYRDFSVACVVAIFWSLIAFRQNRWCAKFMMMFMLPISQLVKRILTYELTDPIASSTSSLLSPAFAPTSKISRRRPMVLSSAGNESDSLCLEKATLSTKVRWRTDTSIPVKKRHV